MGDQHERAAAAVCHFQVPHPAHEFAHGRKLVTLIVQTGLGTHQVHAMCFPSFLHAFAIKKDFDDRLCLLLLGVRLGGAAAAAAVAFAFAAATIGNGLDETFVVPHVHCGFAIVTRLLAAEVIEVVLELLEAASAVPARPYLGTHVTEGQRVDSLAAAGTDGMQFQAPRTKEMTMTPGAQFGGVVSGMVGGKVRTVRLLATITLEAGTAMMLKVPVLEPFSAVQAKIVHAKIGVQFGNHIVMTLVSQENELVLGGGAAMHDGIPVIGRDHDELVTGQHFFEVPYFGQPARSFGDVGQLMEFSGFGLLEFAPVSDGIEFAQLVGPLIFVSVSSCCHQGSSATKIVLVADLDTTLLDLHHGSKSIGAEFPTARAAWGTHVGQIHHEGIIHRKRLVGIQEGGHMFEQMPRGPLRVSPIADSYASTGKIIGQAVGSQVNL